MLFAISLINQGRTLADTQVVRTIPGGLQQAVSIAELATIVLAFALLGAALLVALQAKNAFEKAQGSLDEVGKNLKDLAENAKKISDDVTAMADTVRNDLGEVHETITYANERARHAVTILADRVDSFNNAIGAVQRDTQNAVVTAVSAFKGVKAGLGALRGKKKSRKREAEQDRDGAPESDAALAPDIPARPRLKRRARNRG